MSATFERVILFGSITCALGALGGGYYLARRTGDSHWMNRSGAAIVAAEGIIVAVEFARRARLQKILNRALLNARREQGDRRVSGEKRTKAFDALEEQAERAELQVLIIAILLAMIGELLHGFGDLLYYKLLI